MFNELTSNGHFVALAAAGALIAAGWRQVKAVLQYLSSFLVIQVSLDREFNYPLTRYLRKTWYAVPHGKWWVASMSYKHRTKLLKVYVPFMLPTTPAIFVRKWQIVIFRGGTPGVCQLTTLRFINVKKIISEALEMDVAHDLSQGDTYVSRFCIYDYMGRDKTDFMSDRKSSPSSDSPRTASESSVGGGLSDQSYWVLHGVDKSFMYDESDYLEEKVLENDPFEYVPIEGQELIRETELWSKQRAWFRQRSIPWRRGLLLHGPAGTGKSTLAVVLARKLMIPIYRFYLNTMTDNEFMSFMQQADGPCIILFEDFDRVFRGRDSVTNEHLSFDTVINAMSGVNTKEGAIFVITTNDISCIDPAVGVEVQGSSMSSRPGRIDRILYMGAMEESRRHLMIDRILGDWPDLLESAKFETLNYTVVQTQEYCVQKALQRIH